MDKFNNIKIGQSATIKHEITIEDIKKFVDLTGDDNKLHIDKDYASNTDFKIPVVHGMLGASFISTVIGTKLPGDGALWYSQSLEFLRPVRVGDTLLVTASVISKNEKAHSIELKTDIHNQYNQLVTTGSAKVKIVDQILINPISKTTENQKVVIVLGSTGGIGYSTAINLAQNGFDLILHYHNNKDRAIKLQNIIQQFGRKCCIIKADLLKESSIIEMTQNISRSNSFITGFVNCSTTKIPNIKFKDLEWKYMQEHFDINIKSSFILLKELLPLMEGKNYGKIVFLTTQAIETPNSEWLHYITAKSSLNGFTKALAIELSSKGIRLNMVSPSLTDTELVSDIPNRVKMLIEAKTPLKKLCTIDDIANCITFLMLPKSDFITGETIRVNGGQVMI